MAASGAAARREWLRHYRGLDIWPVVAASVVTAVMWPLSYAVAAVASSLDLPTGARMDEWFGADPAVATLPQAGPLLVSAGLLIGTVLFATWLMVKVRPDAYRIFSRGEFTWMGALLMSLGDGPERRVMLGHSIRGIGVGEPRLFGRIASIAGDRIFIGSDEIVEVTQHAGVGWRSHDCLVVSTTSGEEVHFRGRQIGRLAGALDAPRLGGQLGRRTSELPQ